MKFFSRIYLIFFWKFFFVQIDKYNFNNLNFRHVDFTNYKKIKGLIFKDNLFKINNYHVNSFEFLNFSKNLGGKVGINVSKKNIFNWFKINKYKLYFLWSSELTARRLINILYNYEFINSSLEKKESNRLKEIILFHIKRLLLEFNNLKYYDVDSYQLKAFVLSSIILNKDFTQVLFIVKKIISYQIDNIGMHKSYNILEHAKFINNLKELKNIILFYNIKNSDFLDEAIGKLGLVLNQYYHLDGSLVIFNGSNNNYTKLIYDGLSKNEFYKTLKFIAINNGIAFYKDKNRRIYFDVVKPNQMGVSKNLNAGTLSFEISAYGEKLITNCGASESSGKNPEYLRYSAAHSTIILQNTNISEIKENNVHLKYPQNVSFSSENLDDKFIFEGSHNGYQKKFNKIIKRKIIINKLQDKIIGEDFIINTGNKNEKVIYHIRFHLMPNISFNITNGKKNIILKSQLNNVWLFKSNTELVMEDSILVDDNTTKHIQQIVIKGITNKNREAIKWSIEKV